MKALLMLIIAVCIWIIWRVMVDTVDNMTWGGYYD